MLSERRKLLRHSGIRSAALNQPASRAITSFGVFAVAAIEGAADMPLTIIDQLSLIHLRPVNRFCVLCKWGTFRQVSAHIGR
jgi:hypothetical protein